jgi:hypothetical protein
MDVVSRRRQHVALILRHEGKRRDVGRTRPATVRLAAAAPAFMRRRPKWGDG